MTPEPVTLELVRPSLAFLPEYKAAMERGWSPDNVWEAAATREELEKIADDPAAFIAALDDADARGGPIALPDGSTVPHLPGFRVLRQHRPPLAAGNASIAAPRARPHRLPAASSADRTRSLRSGSIPDDRQHTLL